jgi:hypothetical protein
MKTRPFLVFVLASALGACASWSRQPAVAFRVDCNVPEAAVLLDDVVMGRVSQWSTADRFIKPGFYRVELRHPGYYPYFTEITATDGGSALVKAELHAVVE